MSFLGKFNVSGATTADTMALYNAMYGDFKRKKLSIMQRAHFSLIRRSIEQRLQLVEVTPDSINHDLHIQMAGKFESGQFKGQYKDLVHEHGVKDVDQLKTHRLGGANSNKTAYALIDPEGRTVLAAIYVYRSQAPVLEGKDPYAHLPADVHKILHEELHDIISVPTSVIFFSISRFFKMSGEGELLIAKVHQELSQQYQEHPDVIFSTLSPLRGLKKWCEGKGLKSDFFDDTQRFNAALHFIVEGGKDLVKRFHLSNGAIIGAVRQNSNVGSSEDSKQGLGVMVNYIYDRNSYALLKNAASFSMSKVVERLSDSLLVHIQNTPAFSAFFPK